jgi:histidyl-tRNA synthetase
VSKLVGEVFLGEAGCEHESYAADVEVIHGPDEGTVTLKIGAAVVTLSSVDVLTSRLEHRTVRPVSVAG